MVFVEELELAAGFARVTAKATGRPGYSPADLLKRYMRLTNLIAVFCILSWRIFVSLR